MALQCLSSIIFPVKVIYLPVNVEIKVGSYLNVILDSDLYVFSLRAAFKCVCFPFLLLNLNLILNYQCGYKSVSEPYSDKGELQFLDLSPKDNFLKFYFTDRFLFLCKCWVQVRPVFQSLKW